jgi:antitoxin component YwqK of YwqJK toxin-antitoxin module
MRTLIVIGLLVLGSEMYGQKTGYSINIDSISAFQNHYLNGSRDSNIYYSDKEKDFCIHQTYYKNGRLKSEYFTFKNKPNGPWRTWYPKGNPEFFGYYFNGVPAGLNITWYKSGKIESIGYYDTNIGDTIYGIADSLKTKFIDCDTTIYVDKEPPYDVTDSIVCTDNVLKNGRWTEYHENGALKSDKYFQRGIKVNTWKYYNKEGILVKEEIYNNNKRIRMIKK